MLSITDGQLASWTWARPNGKGRILPQTIAHRGYKAEHPENTLKAFQGAVEVGTHAIETDIHLSKDDVVVLCHVSLKHYQRVSALLMLAIGSRSQTMLWQERKGNRLRLGVPEHNTHP